MIRDPQSIFDNAGKASDAPTAAQLTTPRMHTEVVSTQGGGQLITDDPQAKVVAVVRPNHNYGGVPAGHEIAMPRLEFEANQAALCSKAEYARITAIASSPGHLNLQRQIQSMRAATSDSFLRSLTPEQRALLEERQAQARADDERDVKLRQEMAQAAAPRDRLSIGPAAPTSQAELDARIAALRASYERAAAGLSPKAREALQSAEAAEIAELREQYQAACAAAKAAIKVQADVSGADAVLRKMADALQVRLDSNVPGIPGPQRSIKERLTDLADLYTGGLIDEATYKQRQAQILAEV